MFAIRDILYAGGAVSCTQRTAFPFAACQQYAQPMITEQDIVEHTVGQARRAFWTKVGLGRSRYGRPSGLCSSAVKPPAALPGFRRGAWRENQSHRARSAKPQRLPGRLSEPLEARAFQ